MNFLMKYILKKPVLVALILSLVSYCVYVTISNLALIYLEIISIFLIGFIYIYEFKEPMPRDLRFNISMYFVFFSIIIYFTNDTYDLLRSMYTPAFSILPSFSFFLATIFIKELIKAPLLFVITYIFLYVSGRIYLHLNKFTIKMIDKRVLQEPFILAIIISSIFILMVPVDSFQIADLYKFLLFEIAIIFSLGTVYILRFKTLICHSLKLQTAIYFTVITFIIYILNFTHNYFFSLGNSILQNSYENISFYSYLRLFLQNLYQDTYIIVTFLRFAAVYTFLDIPGRLYFYLKDNVEKRV